jgi:hypothetical protein
MTTFRGLTRRLSSLKKGTITHRSVAVLVGILVWLYILLLWKMEQVLQHGYQYSVHLLLPPSQQQQQQQQDHDDDDNRQPQKLLQRLQSQLIVEGVLTTTAKNDDSNNNNTSIADQDLFLVFLADLGGQGTGNLISGLLAAHLLGQEYHRIVCVHPMYFKFLRVFEPVQLHIQTKCNEVHDKYSNSDYVSQHLVTLVNFIGAADECDLQNTMSDTTVRVVYMSGNTYPRWPVVPANFFLHHYQPKTVLLEALPYTVQPKVVVHLREPDEQSIDPRAGLDETSLTALGELLPRDHHTFLVTNRVEWYHRFEECCSWNHPPWDTITHSATDQNWGTSAQQASAAAAAVASKKYDQNIRMWIDWYTILMAETVYHTHSDFSISAIHWMNNRQSHSIVGYNTDTKEFETSIEYWWKNGETIPIPQRTLSGTPGILNSELRACQAASQQITQQREQQRQQQQQQEVE